MAIYGNFEDLVNSNDTIFNKVFKPGEPAPCPGIYKCLSCKKEIAIAGDHTLPPQNIVEHDCDIEWMLIVKTSS